MPDKDASTPRLFLIRHGETEWSISGRHTGKSEIPLTPHGEIQVSSTSSLAVGPHKLVDPNKLAKIFVSPRSRAQKTAALLFPDHLSDLQQRGVYETEALAQEWDYGAYEGLKPKEIRALTIESGRNTPERPWDIWRDGCEDGESPAQVTARCDALIAKIREIQARFLSEMKEGKQGLEPADVVVVAHGHFTRCFAKRWLGYPLDFPLSLMMEPGGVGVLSYQHHNIDEPALLLGIGFPAAPTS